MLDIMWVITPLSLPINRKMCDIVYSSSNHEHFFRALTYQGMVPDGYYGQFRFLTCKPHWTEISSLWFNFHGLRKIKRVVEHSTPWLYALQHKEYGYFPNKFTKITLFFVDTKMLYKNEKGCDSPKSYLFLIEEL